MLGSWHEHVDELLYDGERVQRRVDLEAATVVVTNDRVLLLTEDEGGANYRTVERPNVARVSVETEDSLGTLVWATLVLFLAIGVLLVAATYDLTNAVAGFDVEDATGVTGGALETVETLLTVFDLTVLAVGGFLLLLAVGLFVQYVRSRTRRLVLRVSGGDDIVLPVTDADLEADRTVALEDAIGPGPVAENESISQGADVVGEADASDTETISDSDLSETGSDG